MSALVYRGMRKELRPMVERARKAGFLVAVDGQTHVRVTNPDTGRFVSLSLTGGSRGSAVAKARAALRRIGAPV